MSKIYHLDKTCYGFVRYFCCFLLYVTIRKIAQLLCFKKKFITKIIWCDSWFLSSFNGMQVV